MTSDFTLMYRQYTNELDRTTAEQLEWEPYGAKDRLGHAGYFVLNLMCLRDMHLWIMGCPLICNWEIELDIHIVCTASLVCSRVTRRSATPSDPPSDHGTHLEDETTSTTHLEDEGVVTKEIDDDMTLHDYQVRLAYLLKPGK
ncbi:hypothetical protein D1007_06690 [Hordeum vulgare]|nr:hypothetical protein D1007_06690 [Hordeum vulgare]